MLIVKKKRQKSHLDRWVFKEFVVNYVFKEFLLIIENNVIGISLVNNLRDSKTKKHFVGRTHIRGNRFYIRLENCLNKETLLKTFIHELGHCLLAKIGKKIHPISEEIRVLQAEKILYKYFSKKQKNQLRHFLKK